MLKMVFKNYYKILDLETSQISIEEIKSAYRQAAKKYHPDVNIGDKLAEEKIKDINEAYRMLSNPASKRKYDRIWNAKFGQNQKAFTKKGEKGTIRNIFLGKIEKEQAEEAKRGENIETQINVSIQEAYEGMEKKIALRTEEGKTKKITIMIPKGIRRWRKNKINRAREKRRKRRKKRRPYNKSKHRRQ